MGNAVSKVVEVVATAAVVVATTAAVIVTAPVEVAVAAVTCAGAAVYGAYQFYKLTRTPTLMSPEDAGYQYPPISTVLAHRGRLDLFDSMAEAVKTKNPAAIELIGEQLVGLSLEGIKNAFIHGVNVGMICSKVSCGKRFENIDDMCYCPEAANECHHNNSCCKHKRSRGMIAW